MTQQSKLFTKQSVQKYIAENFVIFTFNGCYVPVVDFNQQFIKLSTRAEEHSHISFYLFVLFLFYLTETTNTRMVNNSEV